MELNTNSRTDVDIAIVLLALLHYRQVSTLLLYYYNTTY